MLERIIHIDCHEELPRLFADQFFYLSASKIIKIMYVDRGFAALYLGSVDAQSITMIPLKVAFAVLSDHISVVIKEMVLRNGRIVVTCMRAPVSRGIDPFRISVEMAGPLLLPLLGSQTTHAKASRPSPTITAVTEKKHVPRGIVVVFLFVHGAQIGSVVLVGSAVIAGIEATPRIITPGAWARNVFAFASRRGQHTIKCVVLEVPNESVTIHKDLRQLWIRNTYGLGVINHSAARRSVLDAPNVSGEVVLVSVILEHRTRCPIDECGRHGITVGPHSCKAEGLCIVSVARHHAVAICDQYALTFCVVSNMFDI